MTSNCFRSKHKRLLDDINDDFTGFFICCPKKREYQFPPVFCVFPSTVHCQMLSLRLMIIKLSSCVFCPQTTYENETSSPLFHSFILCCIEFVIYADDPPAPTAKRVFLVMSCHCSRSEISSTKSLYGFIMAKK